MTHRSEAPLGRCKPQWVSLDNCAEESVFCNADLVTGFHKGKRICLKTIAGDKYIDEWAYFGPFKVAFDRAGQDNILCQDTVERGSSRVEHKAGEYWNAILEDTGEFVKYDRGEFGKTNKFYCWIPPDAYVNSITVRDRESQFTKTEVDRAKGVRALKLRLGGASDADMMEFIRQSVAVGCPFTPEDVRRASVIYGPDVASLKGKTTNRGPSKATIIDLELGEKTAQTLYCDIFEVEGQPFVLCVMKPLNYRFVAILEGKTVDDTYPAMKAVLDMIWSKGFTIERVEIDPEGGLAKLKHMFQVGIDIVGAGSHVPIAEREGRVVKERARMLLHSLPYKLAARFMKFLVMFIATRLNLMPRKGDGGSLCPRERLTGKKIYFKRELEIGFGDCAEVWSKPSVSNSMGQRTISAIAMCPAGNDQGAWIFYDIIECTLITRTHWKIIPTPDIVIKIMNELEREDCIKSIKGAPTPLARGTPMVGELPAGRMIVNPSLDVPRFSADGQLLPLTIVPRKNRTKTAVVAEAQVGQQVHQDVQHEPVNDGVQLNQQPDEVLSGLGVVSDEGFTDYADPSNDLKIKPLFSDDEDDEPTPGIPESILGEYENIRRSDRIAKRINRMTVKQSVAKYGQPAEDALIKEFKQMVDMEVFTMLRAEDLTADERKRIIHSSAFLKEKLDDNGNFASIKARWVGSGNEMDRGLYESGSSPTVATEAVFTQLALIAGENKKWVTIDIGSAYLHSPMKEFVAVMIAPGLVPYVVKAKPEAEKFIDKKGRLLVKLEKALYGCVQSSRLWYEHMSGVLIAGGFRVNSYDNCVFHKGDAKDQITVCLHVDDLLVSADKQCQLDEL
jgi:hypothetical protein